MMSDSKKRKRDWTQCGEGFSDLSCKNATKTKNGPKKASVKRTSCESSFPTQRNIFENLFGETNDEEKGCSKFLFCHFRKKVPHFL